jgi:tubulin--tyrosine ligase
LGALELFVNPHFLALFAGADYAELHRNLEAERDMDLRAHLTNTSLQIPTPESPDPNDNVRLLSEMVGTPVLSLDGGERKLADKDLETITQMVYQALADTFRAALESPVHFQVCSLVHMN